MRLLPCINVELILISECASVSYSINLLAMSFNIVLIATSIRAILKIRLGNSDCFIFLQIITTALRARMVYILIDGVIFIPTRSRSWNMT